MSSAFLKRARGYPYFLPGHSYVLDGGRMTPFDAAEADRLRQGRTPVLAVGSNQSPEQLARKFIGPDWGPVPVEKCALKDFDTVYSPHITVYGSVPATLQACPGTTVTLYVNWLDDAQLKHMHTTELGNANYVFARMDAIACETEAGFALDHIHLYVGRRGAMSLGGAPVPLKEVPAENRRWKAMSQDEIQRHVYDLTAAELAIEAHILAAVSDPAERQRRTAILEKISVPFTHARLEVLEK